MKQALNWNKLNLSTLVLKNKKRSCGCNPLERF